ncbi:MAG: hypothetical protein DRQ02_01940 [Candidatus Latescibacterota bacterium]|nr:MAG: hypothetical protein DRQ02_01940 [Candidatus Latescibacterota bacterium]
MRKGVFTAITLLLSFGLGGAAFAETGRWPIHNSSSPNADVLTSAYGPRRLPNGHYDIHEGVDISTDGTSKPVYPWKSGTVEDKRYCDNGGYWVKITHPENGCRTGYYHLTNDGLYKTLEPDVTNVYQGTAFVHSGNSGNVAYHLHFNYLLGSVSDPPNNPGQDVLKNARNPMHILPYSNSCPEPTGGLKYIDSQGYVTAIGFYVNTDGTNPDLDKVRLYNDDTGDKLVVDIGNRVNVYDHEGDWYDGEFHATTQQGASMDIQISPHQFSPGGTQTIGFSFNVEDAWHTQNCRATVEDIQGPEINVETTGVEPPNPPTNLHLTAVGSNSVSLAWTAPYGGAQEYHVYYYEEGGGSEGMKVTSSTSTTVTDLSQVKYDFAVKSYDCGMESDFSNWICAAPGHVAEAPTLTAAVPRNNKLDMSWTQACGAVNYKIYKSASPGGGYSYCATASSTSATLTGLNNNTQYYVVVKGHNQIGDGAYSNELTNIPSSCRSDFDSNNKVWTEDFVLFVDHFGESEGDTGYEQKYDLSGNRTVDSPDYNIFSADFGNNCPYPPGKLIACAPQEGINLNARAGLDIARVGSVIKGYDGVDILPSGANQIAVDVYLDGATELKAYGITLHYDPEVLQLLGATADNEAGEGNLLNSAGGKTPLFLVVADRFDKGTIWLANALGRDSKPVHGKGLLAELRFKVLKTTIETSPVRLAAVELFDSQLGKNQASIGITDAQAKTAEEPCLLAQNSPNPFNPSTSISFFLPQPELIHLEVYDLLGQKVKSLADGRLQAGWHTALWDGTSQQGQTVASGVYFCQLRTKAITLTRKMLLLR